MFDTIIQNGTVIDGSGKRPGFVADIGIKKDKIKHIGDIKNPKAKKIIDARGHFVVPGFVDILNHSDSYLNLFDNPSMDSVVTQGITTIIGGNCGSSLAPLTTAENIKAAKNKKYFSDDMIHPPSRSGRIVNSIRRWTDITGFNINWLSFSEYLDEIQKLDLAVNYGSLVGYNSIRRIFTGDSRRELDQAEIEQVKDLITESLKQGALGLSVGLSYSHMNYVTTEEIIQVCGPLGKVGGYLSLHLRNEEDDIVDSVKEAIEIAEKSHVPLHISHFKFFGKTNPSKFDEAMELINAAKNIGVRITYDIYPYDFSWSVMYQYLPTWVYDGGRKKMLQRIESGTERSRIIEDMERTEMDFGRLRVATTFHSEPYTSLSTLYIGKLISEIAEDTAISAEEAFLNVLSGNNGQAICFDDRINMATVKALIKEDESIITTGGAAFNISDKKSGQLIHPRCFGAMTKFLAEMVRDENLITWEKAIHKITQKPAQRIGLNKMGLLKSGYNADVVVLRPEKLKTNADEKNPYQYSEGIAEVISNGKSIMTDSRYDEINRAGEVLH